MRCVTRYDEYLARKRKELGSTFDMSGLAEQFIPYFNNQERIKVDTGFGHVTGTVGVTTGWKPLFLLMRTARSRGSSITLGKKDRIIAVKRGSVYVETD